MPLSLLVEIEDLQGNVFRLSRSRIEPKPFLRVVVDLNVLFHDDSVNDKIKI